MNTLKQKSFERHKYPCLNASNFDYFGTLSPNLGDFGYQQTINTLVRKPYPKKCLDAALFKRETLLSSLSEPAAHRSMEEQLLRKFSEKCAQGKNFLEKMQITLNKVFAILQSQTKYLEQNGVIQ